MDEEKEIPEDKIREANRKMVQEIKNKSDDDFEKNLIYITSGTLILSLTFIEKIAPLTGALWIWFLIISWVLLAFSLLMNLISHQKSSKYSLQYIQEYGEGKCEDDINISIINNNRKISTMNNLTVGLLISGIGFLIVYCSVNAYNMSKEKKVEIVKPSSGSDKISNGRTTPTMEITPKPTTASTPPKDAPKK